MAAAISIDPARRLMVDILNVTTGKPCRPDLAFGDTTTAVGSWTFEKRDDGVGVTWAVEGDLGGFFGRCFGFVAKKVISENFERGLAVSRSRPARPRSRRECRRAQELCQV